ncbi:2-hydroxyacid dehydrogenase [Cognaticolwellia beringensis]|uniref:Glyoxylate/hydroxypyruvate reductase A n=1 Tax=Cognaticolwellia beringensis TaxID=1967665 RepID=A0A222GAE1_9GAMM|nr:glyoxylate/hydroxypyruvate reductase A [Cognaticolwellia beringensis]ASP48682.1 glyoxylate/hydroxypyruvate reductase A [Cognaticolwellia beringensis]
MIPFINQLPKHEEIIWLAVLNQRLPDENIVSYSEVKLADKKSVKLAIVANPDTDLLAEFEHLTWVHSVWAGVEHLMKSLADSPIEVVRLIDPTLSNAMSEAVLAWSLYLHRDMPRYAMQQQNQHWLQHQLVPASERRIGILGLGELGQVSAAQLQKNGFNVMGWSRTAKKIANISCFSGEQGLAEMLAQSDILVCLLPLTQATRGMLNKNLLTQLPQSSAIINFARGGIINTDDLLAALNSNYLSHAVLDVFEHEPLTADSELWQHPDITILPHISAPTNINSACDIVAKNILNFRATGLIPKAVSKVNGY